jgi:hypothetical protein
LLEQIVSWLAYGSLAIGAISAYLHLNKLWSRKHIPEVADSISITGTLLEAMPTMIFGIYFLTRQDPVGVIDSIIWLLAAVGFILIGSGFWVEGKRREGIFRLAFRSIRSEKGELGNLAKSLIHPDSGEELLALLRAMAEVDGEVTWQEVNLIGTVADKMGITLDLQPHTVPGTRTSRLLKTRSALEAYLVRTPPRHQVEKIEDLLVRLANFDNEEHADELASLDEIQGLIRHYLDDDNTPSLFHVLIAPQSEAQVSRLCELLRVETLGHFAGGRGLSAGEFHTREFANVVSREYRELGFFCVVTDELPA